MQGWDINIENYPCNHEAAHDHSHWEVCHRSTELLRQQLIDKQQPKRLGRQTLLNMLNVNMAHRDG